MYGKANFLFLLTPWNIESSCQSIIAIPTEPRGGNHTPAFTKAAITMAAHEATMVISKALALTGYRVLSDPEFFCKVKHFSCHLLCFFWLTNLYVIITGARFVRAAESFMIYIAVREFESDKRKTLLSCYSCQ